MGIESIVFGDDPLVNFPELFYTFENLGVGQYSVLVQDLNSCSISTDIITLTQPEELIVDFLEIGDASCFGYSDGFFHIDVDGGLAPYSYTLSSSDGDILIDNFNTTETNISLVDIPADDYLLSFLDFNNCPLEFIISVGSPTEILTNFSIEETSCFSNGDGSIELDVYGGIPPYEIYFFNNQDSLISFALESEYLFIDNLFQGVYNVQVIDSIECFNNFVFDVSGPEPFDVSYEIIEPTCSYSFDGALFFNIEGGIEPYVINSSLLDEEYGLDIESIGSGFYDINITDFEGCQADIMVDLGVIESDCIEVPSGFTPNGDGFNDTWVVAGSEYLVDANVQVFNRWGQRVFYSQRNKEYWNGYFHNKPLPIADYYYIIEPVEGQPITGRVTIKR